MHLFWLFNSKIFKQFTFCSQFIHILNCVLCCFGRYTKLRIVYSLTFQWISAIKNPTFQQLFVIKNTTFQIVLHFLALFYNEYNTKLTPSYATYSSKSHFPITDLCGFSHFSVMRFFPMRFCRVIF